MYNSFLLIGNQKVRGILVNREEDSNNVEDVKKDDEFSKLSDDELLGMDFTNQKKKKKKKIFFVEDIDKAENSSETAVSNLPGKNFCKKIRRVSGRSAGPISMTFYTCLTLEGGCCYVVCFFQYLIRRGRKLQKTTAQTKLHNLQCIHAHHLEFCQKNPLKKISREKYKKKFARS